MLIFPKTVKKIDKLSDAELASLVYKEKHFKKILDGILENTMKIRKKKFEIETVKHQLKTKLKKYKWKEEAGRLTTDDRAAMKNIENRIADFDAILENIEINLEEQAKHLMLAVQAFRLDIAKLQAVIREEIQLTEKERQTLKLAMKASLPMKKVLKKS